MNKIKTVYYKTTKFVRNHQTAIAIVGTSVIAAVLHRRAISKINDRLVWEYNIDLDAFYDPGLGK